LIVDSRSTATKSAKLHPKAVNVYENNGDLCLQAVGGNILISRQWGGRMASQGGMLIFKPKGGKAWTTDQEFPPFPPYK